MQTHFIIVVSIGTPDLLAFSSSLPDRREADLSVPPNPRELVTQTAIGISILWKVELET